ncbi:MAG: dihydropteroate synthase [Heliobacteriaceae bacterium]|jgi:dihydropteroate synthase|nr:dihydropteroate synthase [Heliobacteriaceae bacterium]
MQGFTEKFILKEIINADMQEELEKIGFDKSYLAAASEKYYYKNIKIYNLTLPQANILKQTAISVGADCAVHREVITSKVEKTDCILGGSISQIKKIAAKLERQPFGLAELGAVLNRPTFRSSGTLIAGILNLTDNSFSDGRLYNDFESAKKRIAEMAQEGADVIDIGAESTKPFSKAVPAKAQLEKLLPILNTSIPPGVLISVDTRSAEVALECIKAGAQIINDVSGLEYDANMADVIARNGVKVVIQHSRGTPENMQVAPHYDSLMDELFLNLKSRIEFAVSKGIKKENIIIDPGIGFGKTKEHNFEIIGRIEELHGLGCPVMLGISRKSFLDMPDNLTKDIFTVALNALAVERKVDYIRVHNVKLHRRLLDINGLMRPAE